MMTYTRLPQSASLYTWSDHLFLRWVEQTPWAPNTKRVLRLLFEHQRRHGRVFLFYRTIANWLRLSIRTVQRAIKQLREAGIVQVQARVTQAGDHGANYYKVTPRILTMTENSDGQTVETPCHSVTTPPLAKPAEPVALSADPPTAADPIKKELLKEKIHNEADLESAPTTSHAQPVRAASVVVSLASPATLTEMAPMADQLGLSPRFIARLCAHAAPAHVKQLLTWALQCPANHPARPRHLEAWLTAGARQGWSTPPSWIAKPQTPSVTYRLVPDKPPDPVPADPTPDPLWQTITAFLESPDSQTEAFLSTVAATLQQRMGAVLAHHAITSQGPTWRAVCKEVWAAQSPTTRAEHGMLGADGHNTREAHSE